MPRIKAYVSDNCIIPVSSAVVDDVYQCKKTQQVYRSKDEFAEHLKGVRSEIHETIAENNLKKIKENLWNLPDFDLVFDYINSNPQLIHRTDSNQNYFKIRKVSISWNNLVRNSHCAPRGKVENWSQNNKLPLGYPGWAGRIHFESKNAAFNIGLIHKSLKKLGIHVGAGGANYKNDLLIGSYTVTMFADDWKSASNDVLAEKTMVLLINPSANFYRLYNYNN